MLIGGLLRRFRRDTNRVEALRARGVVYRRGDRRRIAVASSIARVAPDADPSP